MATVRIMLDTNDGAYEIDLDWPEARDSDSWDVLVDTAVNRLRRAYGSKASGV